MVALDEGFEAVLQTLVGQIKGWDDAEFRAQIMESVEVLRAIAHAHLKRDLKEKVQAGDIKGIKDLINPPVSSTWGSLKFPSSSP